MQKLLPNAFLSKKGSELPFVNKRKIELGSARFLIVKFKKGEGELILSEQYGVLRIRKYQEGAVSGIEKHVERRATISNTNPNIERSHSSQNYDLNGQYDDTFKKQIKERFAECGIEKKKLRKDAVYICECLFTASHEFFKNMSPNDIRQYFEKCYSFACEKFGKENIVSAMVHLDETTPHLHLCFIPIVKNKEDDTYKLNVHSYFSDGGKLSKLQDEVHEKVFKEYGLIRGDKNKKAKHVETLDWKIVQLQEKEESLKKEIEELGAVRDNDKYYKLNKDLKKTQTMLSKMFDTLESSPHLMSEYKKAIQELDRRKEQEQRKNETEEKQLDK